MTPRPLGRTEAGRRFTAGLAIEDGRYHVHVPGVTGTGKTTLLANMVLADADAGRGAVVVDPKGDMITDLLARLPERVAGRLVLIDPVERAAPAALNILDGPDKELAAELAVAVFRRVFAASWGPRMDDIMRCACLTLARVPDSTLADIPALLTEPPVRAAMAAMVAGDTYLRGFWRWYEALTEQGQATAAGPVLSRLRAVLTRRFAADTLGCARSTFDMGKVLDGGLLLARLPKGQIGDDTTRLVGSLIIAKAWQAGLARARIPEHARRDATSTLTSATTSSTCRARWKTSSPKHAATASRWCSRTSTLTSSRASWPPPCPRTRGTRCALPCPPKTRASSRGRWGRY
jgi:hypothetical protein